MPPKTHELPSQPPSINLAVREAPTGLDFLASFYDASHLEAGYAEAGLTPKIRAEIVGRLAQDPDPKIALKALQEDRATRREMIAALGLLSKANIQETRTNEQGQTVTRTLTHERLVLPERNPGIAIKRPIAFEPDGSLDTPPQLQEATPSPTLDIGTQLSRGGDPEPDRIPSLQGEPDGDESDMDLDGEVILDLEGESFGFEGAVPIE